MEQPASETYEWVSTTNLEMVRSWMDEGTLAEVLSRKVTAISDNAMAGGSGRSAFVREIKGRWRKACADEDADSCIQLQFLTDDLLWATDSMGPWRHQGTIFRGDGTAAFRQAFGDDTRLSSAYPSAGGNRFALAISKINDRLAFLDIGAKAKLKEILVFDFARNQWIWKLDAKKEKIGSERGVALSPDGSLVALITQDGILQVYRVQTNGRAVRKP